MRRGTGIFGLALSVALLSAYTFNDGEYIYQEGNVIQTPLPTAQIEAAIARGKRYKNRDEFIEKGLRETRVKLSGTWARDGIVRIVTFYKDDDVIAAEAAESNAQMREISAADFAQVPRTGLLFAAVQFHARGYIGLNKLNHQYSDSKARLVLKATGKLIQAESESSFPSPPKNTCYQTTYMWSVFGSYRFSVGGIFPITMPCSEQLPSKRAIDFAFRIPPGTDLSSAEVYLIDGKGDKQHAPIDLSRLSVQQSNFYPPE